MKIFTLIFLIFLPGCATYNSQEEYINNAYNLDKENIDKQCKINMTDWCRQEYARIDNNKRQDLREDQALVEAANRQNSTAAVIGITTLLIVGAMVAVPVAIVAHNDAKH